MLKPWSDDVDYDYWNDIQYQTLSIVDLYLKPNVFKQMKVPPTVEDLFTALR